VFTATVAESVACTERLRVAGVRAGHIDGSSTDRADLIAAFRAGELDVLSSCAVLTEGFDAPRAKVAVLARGCGSELTYLQIVGRILRPDPSGRRALLLDLVGAVREHGWPTEDRAYSLAGDAIRRASEQEVTIWQCPACGHCQAAAPARRRCPRCDALMPEPEPLRIARLRLDRIARNERTTVDEQAAALRALVVRERNAGRSPYRAVHIFRARYHRDPTRQERSSAGI
jgi:superfamily II DNA or RNA helicase